MFRDDFACFILCHGRPDKTPTYNTLRKFNYTGKIYIICDDEDKTLQGYKDTYGEESVLVFNKMDILNRFDIMDTDNNRGCAVYARNACFELAKSIGIKYFCELDDDYTDFRIRYDNNGKLGSIYPNLDEIFNIYLDFYIQSGITSLAMAQGGDFIGGVGNKLFQDGLRRKCMNSWICSVDRPFTFNGRMNDDVNTYCLEGSRGKIFLTLADVMINQPETQIAAGGMTDMYKGNGTYMKSFYTVLCCPSFAKVAMMGDHFYRIHHKINWETAVPKIISGRYKK